MGEEIEAAAWTQPLQRGPSVASTWTIASRRAIGSPVCHPSVGEGRGGGGGRRLAAGFLRRAAHVGHEWVQEGQDVSSPSGRS